MSIKNVAITLNLSFSCDYIYIHISIEASRRRETYKNSFPESLLHLDSSQFSINIKRLIHVTAFDSEFYRLKNIKEIYRGSVCVCVCDHLFTLSPASWFTQQDQKRICSQPSGWGLLSTLRAICPMLAWLPASLVHYRLAASRTMRSQTACKPRWQENWPNSEFKNYRVTENNRTLNSLQRSGYDGYEDLTRGD
jgi:hypothetical protein